MKKNLLIIFFLMALVIAGCRSSQPIIHQLYLLELPSEQVIQWPEGLSGIPGSCEVTNVLLSPAYASHQIAIREDSHQIRYFTFNEWAMRPEQSLTRFIIDFLEKHQIFDEVKHGRVITPVNYILETEVLHIELDNRHEDIRARLHVSFRLLDMDNGGRVAYQHIADSFQPLGRKHINEFAAAVSQLFMEELHTFSIASMRAIAGDN